MTTDAERAAAVERFNRIHRESRVVVRIVGATPDQNAEAEQAIADYLAAHGWSALDVARGQQVRERWDISGFAPEDAPSDQQMDAASAWDEAEAIAKRIAQRVLGQLQPEVEIEALFDRDVFDAACEVLWPKAPFSDEDPAAEAALKAAIVVTEGVPQECSTSPPSIGARDRCAPPTRDV